jgi:anaerobic magnesium-protoporphyrin IX monomethyl ester cyclase
MAKILFVQHELMELLGVMSISSYVKSQGHETGVFIPGRESEFLALLTRERPDVVGFSCTTGLEDKLLRFARLLDAMESRRPLVIFGGPHPTFYPEIIEDPVVDMICRGQGERPVAELLARIDNGQPLEGIENLWIRKKGEIEKNPQAELITNFEAFPYPDRGIYGNYKVILNNPTKHFITLRECPFDCSFCFNHAWKAMHPTHPAYKNRRPEHVIREINEVRSQYPTKIVLFWDGTFNLNRKWLDSFLELYREEVGLPFRCNLRADLVDEETVRALKESGCAWVKLGVESGNEAYRNRVLNKKITDEDFVKTSDLLRKYRIPFSTFNMLGLPGETLEMTFETLKLNIRLKPQHTFAFVYLPFPRTQLGQYALDEGYLETPKIGYEYADSFKGSPLKLEDKDQIENLQKLFALTTQVPALLPLVRLLIKLPPNQLFVLVEKVSRFLFFWCRSANSAGMIPAIKEYFFGFGFRREKAYDKLAPDTGTRP